MAGKAVVSVRLDQGLMRRVEAHASAQGITHSEAIRQLVEAGLASFCIDLYAGPVAELIHRVVQIEFAIMRQEQSEANKTLEERVAKVCSRGSKAALANLLQTVDLSRALVEAYRVDDACDIYNYYSELGGRLQRGESLEEIRPPVVQSPNTATSSWTSEIDGQ